MLGRDGVTLGPIPADEIGAVSCVLVSRGAVGGAPTGVNAEVLDTTGEMLAESRLRLAGGEQGAVTLELASSGGDELEVRLAAEADGIVELYYLAAFSASELVLGCNAAGSDKGSEVFWGDGFPHFYALEYERIFSAFRRQRFDFLEIGLDAATYKEGQPDDAPSMRVWREFFPNARLFGYDLHDFGFFEQRDTHLFQGDQSSRADIARFLEDAKKPRFRLVIDDASHASSHQQISLASLFGSVEDGGIYIIEDLDWQPFEEAPTTREVLERFARTGRIESPFLSEQEACGLESEIAGVEILKPNEFRFAVIRKRERRAGAVRRLLGRE